MNKEIRLSLANAILNQTSLLGKKTKFIRDELYDLEQRKEAEQAEAVIENNRNQQVAVQESPTKKEDPSDESSFFGKILKFIFKDFIIKIIALSPLIAKLFRDNKETILSLPKVMSEKFMGAVAKLKDVINSLIVKPISDFFTIKLPAAWDTLTEVVRNAIDNIIDVPVLLINSFKLLMNDIQLGIIETFKDFLSDSFILKALGIQQKVDEYFTGIKERLEEQKKGLEEQEKQTLLSRAERQKFDAMGYYDRGVQSRTPEKKEPTATKLDSLSVTKEIPPEGRALLDAITTHESVDGAYNVIVGYGSEKGLTAKDREHNKRLGYDRAPATFSDFSKHPGIRGMRTSGGPSTAAGRYQFVEPTWAWVSKEAKLTDFSPANQDKGAWWLAKFVYNKRTGRNLEEDLKIGTPELISSIGRNLSETWTSLAGGSEQAKGMSNEYFTELYTKSLENQMQQSMAPSPITDNAIGQRLSSTSVEVDKLGKGSNTGQTIKEVQVPVYIPVSSNGADKPVTKSVSSDSRQAALIQHFAGIGQPGYGVS